MAKRQSIPAKSTGKAPPRKISEMAWIGHGLSGLLGLITLVFGFYSIGSLQITLTVGLVVLGALLGLLSWQSLHGSRRAWAFLVVTNGWMAIALLFGAPSVRDHLHLGLGAALVPSAVFLVSTVFLALLKDDYASAPFDSRG